jgi:hypothetical protein
MNGEAAVAVPLGHEGELQPGQSEAPRTCQAVLDERDPHFYCLSVPAGVAARLEKQRWWRESHPAGVLIGLVLVVVLVIADLAQRLPHFPWPEVGWLVLILVEIGALLTLPATLWKRLKEAATTLDDLLYDEDNAEVAAWLDRKLVPPAHLAWCLLGVGVGVGASVVVSNFHWAGARLISGRYVGAPFSVSYYVATGILGFFAFDVIRWVWRSPVVLRYVAKNCPVLRINKLAPADTPSVRKMSELLASGSLRAALGLAMFAAPFVWIIADSPNHKYRLDLALFTGAPMLVALVTAAYFSFVPQRWLTSMLAAQQARVLDGIARPRFIDGEVDQPSDELDRAIKLYQTIAAGAVQTPAARATIRNVGKVVLAVAPYVAAFVAKMLHLKVGG